MARRELSVPALAAVLGCSVPAARTRYRGDTPFDLAQIDAVVDWLGLDQAGVVALLGLDEEIVA